MNKMIATIATLMALSANSVQAQSLSGVWRTAKTTDGTLEIKMSRCGNKICGTIVGARNPDGTVGTYPHIGRKMIWNMTANGAQRWSGGKLWDPRRDRTFSSKMELKGKTLKVSGCFLSICQAQTWQRIR